EIMFWGKTNPLPTCNNTYLNDIEYLLFFRDKNVKIEGNYESKSKFYISGSNYYDKKYWSHPTIKPLRMVKNLIINSSTEGDLILDPFIGSGTTALACKDLKRNYVGFEIDEEYYKIANERIEDFTTDSSVNVNTSAMSIYDFGIEV
ncbi:MAG: site-specific DNA-methyltransferase, partial [Sulfolobaceae archaeon]